MPSDERKISGLERILANAGTLHHIHAPGENGPDDPGAPPFIGAGGGSGAAQPPVIITSPSIQRRYATTLERLARERHEAAYEWTRLHWWQWRKRKRLYRKLFGLGGWSMLPFNECDALGIPRRVVPTTWVRRGFSE